MQRTVAAVRFLNGTNATQEMKMAAFLHIFHPEMSPQQMRAITNDVRDRERR
jgi:hypothetical protein